MRNQQYYINPPNIPEYLYRSHFEAWRQLMIWSWNEYQERLKRLSRNGHYKELHVQASKFSPERVLAESTGFRKKCSIMTSEVWDQFTRAQQDYLIRCYDLRDLLLRDAV